MNHTSTLLKIINNTRPVLLSQNQELMKQKPSINNWSKQEIVGHLIDSGNNNLRRFKRALHQDHLIFEGYDQEKSVEKAKYQSKDWDSLVNEWFDVNQKIVNHIAGIDNLKMNLKTNKHNFHQICMRTIPETENTNLRYLIEDYIFHLEHHLIQILSSYQRLIN